jgi:molybdate transport system substrate-binding protein
MYRMTDKDNTDPVAGAPERGAAIVVFCPGAVQSLVRDLVRDFEQTTPYRIKFEFAPAIAIASRIGEGAAGDVVITLADSLARLADSGQVDGSTIRSLGSVGVGVAVRAGTLKPEIRDLASFQRAMLAAQSIMYSLPAKGGQSGIHIAKVFAEIGIDKQLEPKLRLRDRGMDGLVEVAAGDIEIGLAPISEIVANKGLDLVGPFPDEIQGAATFCAAVHAACKNQVAAKALVAHLTAPAAKALFAAKGFTVN